MDLPVNDMKFSGFFRLAKRKRRFKWNGCKTHRISPQLQPLTGGTTLLYLIMIVMAFVSASPAWAEEPMYRCEDGTFTNRVELLCQPYESKGKVLILPTGMSMASVRTLMGPPTLPGESSQRVNLSDPTNVCNLYKEWLAMNLQTGGGVTFPLTQDVPRWVALARMFPAGVPPPNCQ